MGIPFLGEIERLINERGSASILRERMALLQEQLVLHKAEFAKLQEENAQLRKRVESLAGQVAAHAAAQEYEEHRGALFKRRAGGGYHDAVYCPRCRAATAPFPPGAEFNCSCGWFSSFTEDALPRIKAELP